MKTKVFYWNGINQLWSDKWLFLWIISVTVSQSTLISLFQRLQKEKLRICEGHTEYRYPSSEHAQCLVSTTHYSSSALCQLLGHSLVYLLICSHRLLICLLCTACFACARRCAHSFVHLLTHSFPSSCKKVFCQWKERVDFKQFKPTAVCQAFLISEESNLELTFHLISHNSNFLQSLSLFLSLSLSVSPFLSWVSLMYKQNRFHFVFLGCR